MEDELISKKELLELTGISYGQLYRWKRKNLIPEQWFIRKSAFTGQETFFPKQQILARIDKIKNMKDDLSLDELAEVFSPIPADLSVNFAELVKRNIVSENAAQFATEYIGKMERYTFEQAMHLYIFDQCLRSGAMNLSEGEALLRTLADHYKKFAGKSCELILIRKMGVSVFLLTALDSEICFEHDVKIILRVNIAKQIEELKLKLTTM
ncbi:MAG TPA: YhbD family protein [Bacilli bacterium]